jgi:ubiquinone/menaquinone biosynthesis C-methylase UbiE
MTIAASAYSETRYLRAKRSVDDRALHGGVLASFQAALAALPTPPRVLELGAGVGTMATRLAERGVIRRGQYTMVDSDGDSLRSTRRPDGTDLEIELVQADAFAWLEACNEPPFDAVIASAFLDLVDVPALLPLLWRRLRPGAPFWFPINFDGETIFLPELPADAAVLRRYHETMDQRVRGGRRAGESRAGRHLLRQIPESGARLTAAGSSDWVVWPAAGGAYPEDEAYFLHHIVRTIEVALARGPGLDPGELASWAETRHRQIDAAQLIYIAHQLDVTGLAPG